MEAQGLEQGAQEPNHSQTSGTIVSALILFCVIFLVVLGTSVLNIFVISVDKDLGKNVHSM